MKRLYRKESGLEVFYLGREAGAILNLAPFLYQVAFYTLELKSSASRNDES